MERGRSPGMILPASYSPAGAAAAWEAWTRDWCSCMAGRSWNMCIDALRPQVGGLLISANRNRDVYASTGSPVTATVTG